MTWLCLVANQKENDAGLTWTWMPLPFCCHSNYPLLKSTTPHLFSYVNQTKIFDESRGRKLLIRCPPLDTQYTFTGFDFLSLCVFPWSRNLNTVTYGCTHTLPVFTEVGNWCDIDNTTVCTLQSQSLIILVNSIDFCGTEQPLSWITIYVEVDVH